MSSVILTIVTTSSSSHAEFRRMDPRGDLDGARAEPLAWLRAPPQRRTGRQDHLTPTNLPSIDGPIHGSGGDSPVSVHAPRWCESAARPRSPAGAMDRREGFGSTGRPSGIDDTGALGRTDLDRRSNPSLPGPPLLLRFGRGVCDPTGFGTNGASERPRVGRSMPVVVEPRGDLSVQSADQRHQAGRDEGQRYDVKLGGRARLQRRVSRPDDDHRDPGKLSADETTSRRAERVVASGDHDGKAFGEVEER
jgi:hypothetical protein